MCFAPLYDGAVCGLPLDDMWLCPGADQHAEDAPPAPGDSADVTPDQQELGSRQAYALQKELRGHLAVLEQQREGLRKPDGTFPIDSEALLNRAVGDATRVGLRGLIEARPDEILRQEHVDTLGGTPALVKDLVATAHNAEMLRAQIPLDQRPPTLDWNQFCVDLRAYAVKKKSVLEEERQTWFRDRGLTLTQVRLG